MPRGKFLICVGLSSAASALRAAKRPVPVSEFQVDAWTYVAGATVSCVTRDEINVHSDDGNVRYVAVDEPMLLQEKTVYLDKQPETHPIPGWSVPYKPPPRQTISFLVSIEDTLPDRPRFECTVTDPSGKYLCMGASHWAYNIDEPPNPHCVLLVHDTSPPSPSAVFWVKAWSNTNGSYFTCETYGSTERSGWSYGMQKRHPLWPTQALVDIFEGEHGYAFNRFNSEKHWFVCYVKDSGHQKICEANSRDIDNTLRPTLWCGLRISQNKDHMDLNFPQDYFDENARREKLNKQSAPIKIFYIKGWTTKGKSRLHCVTASEMKIITENANTDGTQYAIGKDMLDGEKPLKQLPGGKYPEIWEIIEKVTIKNYDDDTRFFCKVVHEHPEFGGQEWCRENSWDESRHIIAEHPNGCRVQISTDEKELAVYYREDFFSRYMRPIIFTIN